MAATNPSPKKTKTKKKKTGPALPFPPPGAPISLKDLLTALGKAGEDVLASLTALDPWIEFNKIDHKHMNGKWKKLIPKLGGAICQLLAGPNVPAILKPLLNKSADLADRDTLVQKLEAALANANSLTLLLSKLLMYHKSEYYKETTGTLADIKGLIANSLIDQNQKRELEKQAQHVLEVGNEIAQEPFESRKLNDKLKAEAVQASQDANKNPELDAKDLEIKVMRGGSVTAADLTQEAAPKAGRRQPR